MWLPERQKSPLPGGQRRRRGGAPRGHDISSAARTARTNEDAHGVQGGLGGGPGGVPGGVGGGGVGAGT